MVSLIDISHFDCLADVERSGVGFFLPHDQTEQRCLAGAVGTDHSDDACRRQCKVKIFEKLFLAEGFGESVCLDHLVAQTGTVGYEYFETLFLLFLIFVEQTVIARQTRFALGLTCFGRHAYPFELAFESLAALRRLFFLESHAFGFLFEPR